MIALTREMLAAAYDLLELTEPFCRWNLPSSDEIKFEVTGHKGRQGECVINGPDMHVRISTHHIGRIASLMETMAHEMVHLHTYVAGITEKDPHGPGFRKLALQVCRVHGFDPKQF
jgi:hypothetical protein